ncbi:MAG: ferrous iron transport protein B [Spirochaetales bacterium]|nr:ferrous iron transport protein B [Spirochaetales bacterium]
MKEALVALVGNPNTGKSSVFNTLCGMRQKIGNYPGVTIDRKEGSLSLSSGPCRVLDLPGTYSLRPNSPDEEVVCRVLLGDGGERPDLLVYILDTTNLRRNLFLLSQVGELGLPLVICLTMSDMLKKSSIEFDSTRLENLLGVPVVRLDKEHSSAADLQEAIASALKNKARMRSLPEYPSSVEKAIQEFTDHPLHRTRFEAVSRIYYPELALAAVKGSSVRDDSIIADLREKKLTAPSLMLSARYNWSDRIARSVEKRGSPSPSYRLDRLFTHRWMGPAFFVGVMTLVFQSIYSWALPLMDAIELLLGMVGEFCQSALQSTPMFASLVNDGIVGGVGSVLVFVPQIALLFLFIAILEDSGYLARAAFLMDRLLSWTGLNGRAFIPMLSSFACAVPGVMAARVLPEPRVRMATILIAPLMSCSARLPVYLLFIGTFIEPLYGPLLAGLALFFMHTVGLIVGLPVAYILNRKILKSPVVPFILELPPYRLPAWRNVFFRVYEATKKFVVRAGSVIFALSIVIWALAYFPRDAAVAEELKASALDASSFELALEARYMEESYLGRAGKAIQPFFAPLGYDWKLTVGVLGAFPAREVIIATLGILYAADVEDEEASSLRSRLASSRHADGTPVFTIPVVAGLLVFFALCSQCMSTLVTVGKELRSWRWSLFLFTYMTVLAYIGGFATKRGLELLGGLVS